MSHVIETAKTGRASCKVCKQAIEKGDLRLGEEFPNPFSEGQMSYRWHHLQCGAKKKPSVLRQAMELTDIEVPDKDELEKIIESCAKSEKPTELPFSEFAPTGRSACIQCGEKIEKDCLRVAVNTDTEAGSFGMRKGFLHPACAIDFTSEDPQDLYDKLVKNSRALDKSDYEALEAEIFA